MKYFAIVVIEEIDTSTTYIERERVECVCVCESERTCMCERVCVYVCERERAILKIFISVSLS